MTLPDACLVAPLPHMRWAQPLPIAHDRPASVRSFKGACSSPQSAAVPETGDSPSWPLQMAPRLQLHRQLSAASCCACKKPEHGVTNMRAPWSRDKSACRAGLAAAEEGGAGELDHSSGGVCRTLHHLCHLPCSPLQRLSSPRHAMSSSVRENIIDNSQTAAPHVA